MGQDRIPFGECDKTCPRDCEILNRILLREARMEHLYITLIESCDYPDIRRFAQDLLSERRQHVSALEKSLVKMYCSFDPSGC